MADQANTELVAEHHPDGTVELRSVIDGTSLTFTAEEWAAFRSGVVAGEFGHFSG